MCQLRNLDGLIYLPEIKYRRILNTAFGPGGWGLAPRGETNVSPRMVSREYALVCLGRSAVFFSNLIKQSCDNSGVFIIDWLPWLEVNKSISILMESPTRQRPAKVTR